jgi:hypothetical protein
MDDAAKKYVWTLKQSNQALIMSLKTTVVTM